MHPLIVAMRVAIPAAPAKSRQTWRAMWKCGFEFQPAYRLWNQRADTNHRFT
jgi:hypothetical protein